MAKITAYSALTTPQSDDVLPIVDVHDTTMSPSGTTKKITVGNLLAGASGSGIKFTPTAVKTGAYSASPGDFVPCDTTSAGFTVTLPNAPADGSVVAVKQVIQGGTNTVTVACAGSDVFNKAGGGTSGTLTLLSQGMLLQYKAAGGIWYVLADDLPLGQLDLRYAAPSFAASSRSLPLYIVPPPSGDASGSTDTSNISAVENAATTAGGLLVFAPGTYITTGLTKKSGTIWQGAGRLATFIQLANGANADVVQGSGFSSLTLGGTTGGISGWAIRDMCIDGNKTNQSGTSYGLRFYGYEAEVSNVTIRNCLSWGLYTEWANNPGGITEGMESRYRSLKIHNNSGGGWHDRGPHDARSWDCTIWANSATQAGYWAETSQSVGVAAGSNGVDLSTFTSGSPGTLNIATTLGYPTASISATQGSVTVTTALGPVVLTFTGTTATSITGCVAQGSPASGSTVSTGAAVTPAGGGFTANGQLHTQMHVYANPMWCYILDCQVHLLDCVGEVTQAGGAMVLLRYGNCQITGGLYVIYGGVTQLGAGIQLGDAANAATSNRIDTALYGFAGTSAATAALNIVNSGANNSIDLAIYQTSGQAVFGSPSRDRVRIFSSGSGVYATDAANSSVRDYGAAQHFMPSVTQAWRLSNSGGDYLNLNASSNRNEHVGGILDRWYSDQYSTPTVEISGANGSVRPGTIAGLGARIYSGSGAPNVSGSVTGDIYIRTDNGTSSFYIATGSNTWKAQLDGTAANIQPAGVQAAGSGGLAADSAHVHPSWVYTPADLGLLAYNFDPWDAGSSASVVNGTIYMIQFLLRQPKTITNGAFYIAVAAVTATANQNFIALVDSTGTIRASTAAGAIDTATQSSGWLSQAFSSTYAAPAGIYTLAILLNAATPLKFATKGINSATGANAGRSGANLRMAVNGTGATSLPGSFTMGANSSSGVLLPSVGVS